MPFAFVLSQALLLLTEPFVVVAALVAVVLSECLFIWYLLVCIHSGSWPTEENHERDADSKVSIPPCGVGCTWHSP